MEIITTPIRAVINVWLRLRQQDRIDELTAIQGDLLALVKRSVEDRHALSDVQVAALDWLQARIAFATMDMRSPGELQKRMATVQDASDLLENAARKAFMRPGMRGSWGRGVPRDWLCGFDPEGGGCECAGHGRTAETSDGCYYRAPIGAKGDDR